MTAAGAHLDGIVVGAVRSVERHPNADRLSVCDVDDGGDVRRVVCGAPNVRPGVKVPFARVGARLPDGREISAVELRGVASAGMLCSAKELNLGDDASGLLLLDDDAPLGVALQDYLRLEDTVFDVNVTPNRGDCFSVLGLAREIGARLGGGARKPNARAAAESIPDTVPVELSAPAALSAVRGPCRTRYRARVGNRLYGFASACAGRAFGPSIRSSTSPTT